MDTYQYLFPYEKVPMGSRILIYGAGILGREYLKQIQITKYCNVVGFVDKNTDVIAPLGISIYVPENISSLNFDRIVIALRNDHCLRDVKRVLYEQGVEEEDIVCVCQRDTSVANVGISSIDMHQRINVLDLAYTQKKNMSIALYIKGGIGDMIIAKRFVEELIRLMPDCAIDLYTSYDLSWLYSDCVQVNKLLRDNEVLYRAHCQEYTLAITVDAYFLEVDCYTPESIPEKYRFMIDKVERLREVVQEENVASTLCPKIVAYMRRIYKGYNCYTGYSYGGVFDIQDTKVHIPLEKQYEVEFERLNLQHYITVNSSNGDSEEASIVAKAWPLSNYDKVVDAFKRKYPDIRVIQLGGRNAKKIRNIDRYILGESFGLVKYVLKNSMCHLDIEGGLVHLASQLGTKCVVLFGPTNARYVGYPQNVNIKAGTCHDCYGLYNDLGRCARNLQEPECMYSITPEIVMEAMKQVLTCYD